MKHISVIFVSPLDPRVDLFVPENKSMTLRFELGFLLISRQSYLNYLMILHRIVQNPTQSLLPELSKDRIRG